MNKYKVSIDQVEEEIYSKRRTVRYDIRDLTVEAISNKYEDSLDNDETGAAEKNYNYIYIPEYQRDFTWDKDRQSKLIESIILGLPIPFIFVAENRDSSWEIVDGSQRIRAIHSFLNNELCLRSLQSIKSLNGYTFEELDKSRQGKILNTALRIIVLAEETTDSIKKDMFERINMGSDLLKPMEKRKGICTGKFTTFLYEYCAQNEKYRSMIKIDKWLAKRCEREELLLRFFAITDKKSYETGISGGIAIYLDEYLKEKNKEWEKLSQKNLTQKLNEYKKRINMVLEYVEKNFPYDFRHKQCPQTKRSVFEAISVGVWKSLSEQKALKTLNKEYVKECLDSQSFKQYTHVANELHKRQKLQGRVMFIYHLVTTAEEGDHAEH